MKTTENDLEPAEPAATSARAVVADDHPLYRAGIVRTLIATGRFVVVGEAGDGETALALIFEHRPELAVIDVRIPRLDGLSLLDRLRREHLSVPVLMLSAFTDRALVDNALARGAVAYVDKQAGREELAAVAVAIIGGDPIDRARREASSPILLPIEQTILSLLRDGLALRDIPYVLDADRATVERYARDASARLGARNLEEAVTAALAWGLLP